MLLCGGNDSARHFVQPPPARVLLLDASKRAVRVCVETGLCCSYEFSAGERARLCGNSYDVRSVDGISINVAAEVGIITLAPMLVVVRWIVFVRRLLAVVEMPRLADGGDG